MMKMPVIEKFLTRAGETRDVVTTDQTGKRFLPAKREAFQLVEERAVDQGGRFCGEWHGYSRVHSQGEGPCHPKSSMSQMRNERCITVAARFRF